MERKVFDSYLKEKKYISGGIKEACLIVSEYIKNIKKERPDNTKSISSPNSAVTPLEFANAVKVLMAFTETMDDHIPESYYCEDDCLRNDDTCPGRCLIAGKDEAGYCLSKKRCPHYWDPSNI